MRYGTTKSYRVSQKRRPFLKIENIPYLLTVDKKNISEIGRLLWETLYIIIILHNFTQKDSAPEIMS